MINLILGKKGQRNQTALALTFRRTGVIFPEGDRALPSTFYWISPGKVKQSLNQRRNKIIWNETAMSNKGAFDALDITWSNIRGCSCIICELTVVLEGDFRKIIVARGTRANQVNA